MQCSPVAASPTHKHKQFPLEKCVCVWGGRGGVKAVAWFPWPLFKTGSVSLQPKFQSVWVYLSVIISTLWVYSLNSLLALVCGPCSSDCRNSLPRALSKIPPTVCRPIRTSPWETPQSPLTPPTASERSRKHFAVNCVVYLTVVINSCGDKQRNRKKRGRRSNVSFSHSGSLIETRVPTLPLTSKTTSIQHVTWLLMQCWLHVSLFLFLLLTIGSSILPSIHPGAACCGSNPLRPNPRCNISGDAAALTHISMETISQ